ncbi:TPA: ABC transporter six-transmembrane domain-containing protein, partial [Klebsiella pneumoniae]
MAPGVAISLKRLAWRHRKKLCITFMLVIAEN